MKIKAIVFSVFLILNLMIPFSHGVCASSGVSAESVSELIREAAPLEFGYVDNTEYYMQYYFHGLTFVDDSCIVVSSESTNFNEFGVFHVTNAADAKRCETLLKTYLAEAKQRFQSGVVYDIDQYPKFENAIVRTVDDFVFYMILEPDQSTAAIREIQTLLG